MNTFVKWTLGGVIGFMLSTGLVQAGECFTDHTEPAMLGDGSRAFATQQARNKWEDWIWRGPLFVCSSRGTVDCTYAWGETKTSSYGWSVGVKINPDKLPFVGKYLTILGVDGSYKQDRSMSTSFTWSVRVQPGYRVQPIQVIERRWKSGQFRGAWVQNGSCSVGVGQPAGRHWYEWDSKRVIGNWSGNLEVSRYATYHVYR
jgi:hypothetical protein